LEARPQDLGEEERSESPWNELPWIGTDLLLPVIIELAILCAILSTSSLPSLFSLERNKKQTAVVYQTPELKKSAFIPYRSSKLWHYFTMSSRNYRHPNLRCLSFLSKRRKTKSLLLMLQQSH
jgi:hypothetical protein